MTSGIYAIKNTITSEQYIGSSNNIELSVIRQNSWPFSAMINASNWLASDLEAVFDHQPLPHKMPRHFSSSFWSWSARGKGVKFATYYDTCLYKGACRRASFSAR